MEQRNTKIKSQKKQAVFFKQNDTILIEMSLH